MKLETIGTDIEFGLLRNNTPYSIEGLLGGTKEQPLSIGNGCFRQEDNVNAEFCTPPTLDVNEFVENIFYCKEQGNKILKEIDPGFELIASSSLNYDESFLKTNQASKIACDVSFDAYTGLPFEKKFKEGTNFRTCGFHIHIGFDDPYDDDFIIALVKSMDLFVGLPATYYDMDDQRRSLYGDPGDFRFKPYGIEYRTVGGNILGDRRLIKNCFNNTIKAFDFANDKSNWKDLEKVKNNVITAIRTRNINLIEELCNNFNIELLPIHIDRENLVILKEITNE